MPKLRKQRKRKTYHHNINRKRKRNKMMSTGTITCKEVKVAWEEHKSVAANLKSMGLSHDPNKTINISQKATAAESTPQSDQIKHRKGHVAEALEQDAKAPRERQFQLPNSQVQWVTYLMDTHGLDYKAMARDKKNYYQQTWKQIRAKIRQFKGIPDQYAKYLQERNLQAENIAEESNCEDDSD